MYAQLEKLEEIQNKRKFIWNKYYQELYELEQLGKIKLPILPDGCTNNAHLFYMIFPNNNLRDNYLSYMREFNINPVFHYLSLHKSMFYQEKHGIRELTESDKYSETLVRLPLFYSLEEEEIDFIVRKTKDFFY